VTGNPRVLITADYYLPGFRAGGPIRGIANTIARLAGEVTFFVVTRDHDADGSPHRDILSGRWNQRSDAAVYYAPRFSTRILEECLRDSRADVVWLNSFFSRASLRVLLSPRVRRLQRPILLAPRGELSPAALALKAGRKRLAITALGRLGVLDGVQWVASSTAEAEEIRSIVPAAAITIAPESVRSAAPPRAWRVKQPGRLRAVCAARIAPMKNQHFLLDALARCPDAITLDLIGPIDDPAYWARCQQTMIRLPAHVSVHYVGELAHGELMERLPSYDVLVLPTRGENFGHVIVEAWAAGCPVLISDRTPWRDLATDGVGRDLPLDPQLWIEAVQHGVAMTNDELLTMRHRAIERARRVWSEGRSGDEALRELFVQMAQRVHPTDDAVAPAQDPIVADTNTCA
jgi:glycosyltransferase involved in cell wall biosynthesis